MYVFFAKTSLAPNGCILTNLQPYFPSYLLSTRAKKQHRAEEKEYLSPCPEIFNPQTDIN